METFWLLGQAESLKSPSPPSQQATQQSMYEVFKRESASVSPHT